MAHEWVCTFMVVFSVFSSTNCANRAVLYSETDDVTSLNVTSFNETVLGSENAWLVKFYSSWCGHCVRYAPLYKQLATDVKGIIPFC